MSAMAAIIQHDRVHILSDAAFYDSNTGVLQGTYPKVWPIAGLRAVFSSRGAALAFPILADLLAGLEVKTFDDLAALLPVIFEAHDTLMEDRKCEMLVAGWSESRNAPAVYYRCSHAGWEGLQTGVVYRFDEGVAQFGLDDGDFPTAEEFDVERHAVTAFEAARARPQDLRCGERTPVMGYSIGGAIIHGEITFEGVDITVLKAWPDVNGKSISPMNDGKWGDAPTVTTNDGVWK